MPSRPQIVAYFLIVLFLCSWHLDHGTNDSTLSRAMAVSAIVETGSSEFTAHQALTGDKALVDGRYYTDKAPLPTWILVPFWALARVLGAVPTQPDGSSYATLLRLGGFFWGSIPFACIAVVLWTRLYAWGSGIGAKALAVALPLFGSFLFVYSGSFYNHIGAALFVLLSTLALEKERPLLAGLWASAALLTDTAVIVVIAVQFAQVAAFRPIGAGIRFSVATAVGLLLLMLNNHIITGSTLTFPSAMAANYPHMKQGLGFRGWSMDALLGLTVSLYRGLFIYMPALIALVLIRPLSSWRAWAADPFVLPAIALIIAYAAHSTWSGGWTYGPRYITCSALLLLAFMLKHLRTDRKSLLALFGLATVGALCALAAISTLGYSLPSGITNPLVDLVWPAVRAGRWTDAQLPVLLGLSPATSTLLYLFTWALGVLLLTRIDHCIHHAPVPLS